MFLILFIFYLFLKSVNAGLDFTVPGDVVTLPQGQLLSLFSLAGNYRSFLGIPYATVPARFQAPGTPPSWDDTIYANTDTAICKQYIKQSNSTAGSEDCLGLNIFTPLTTQEELLPVLVSLHGGGFYGNSNNHSIYDPKYLVQKKVIVVTINYRLGAFGFLCLRNEGAPGNVGLKDQIAALRWVKNNIAFFGGNPNSVTLFGEDAGGTSINYLIASSASNGLFKRVILQSGTMFTPLALDGNPVGTASLIASRLGMKSTDPDELLAFFKNVSANELVKASYRDAANNPLATYEFKPCVEASVDGAVIKANPRELLKSSNLNSDVNVIIGYTANSGRKFASKYDYVGFRRLLEDLTPIIPQNINFPNKGSKKSFEQDIKKMYFQNDKKNTYFDGLVNYFSDAFIDYPSVVATESFLKYTNVSVYNYYFNYNSTRNIAGGVSWGPSADHGDELFFLFEPRQFQQLAPMDDDAEVIYKKTTMGLFCSSREPINSCKATLVCQMEKKHVK